MGMCGVDNNPPPHPSPMRPGCWPILLWILRRGPRFARAKLTLPYGLEYPAFDSRESPNTSSLEFRRRVGPTRRPDTDNGPPRPTIVAFPRPLPPAGSPGQGPATRIHAAGGGAINHGNSILQQAGDSKLNFRAARRDGCSVKAERLGVRRAVSERGVMAGHIDVLRWEFDDRLR